MRVTSVMVLAALLLTSPAHAQTAPTREALDGIDPVLLIQQAKEVAGKAEFKVTRGRFDYLFATADTKATFERQPEKYEIQLGGVCARMGAAATGNPSDYAVVDGKIYIFGSDDCHKKFVAAPEKFLPKPAAPMPTAAADSERGRALIERAVHAIGGEKVDAILTYVESSTQLQKRPTGDVPITLKTMWRFPGSVRTERSMTQKGKTMTAAQLSTPAGSWYLGQGRVYPQTAEARAVSDEGNGRHLVPLLRGRHDGGFQAAALGSGTVAGVDVERVRVKNGPVDVTLGIENTSGRIHSVEFTGRNLEGEIGAYTLVLSDYRDVAGLSLPFSERALFNGAPDSFLTRTIDTIQVNPSLDAALFEPRAGGGQ